MIVLNNKRGIITNFRLSFIETLLIMALLIFLFTEFLSLFNRVTLPGISICWLISLIILFSLYILKFRKKIKQTRFKKIKIERSYKITIIISILLIILPLLFLALYYYPSLNDSLSYHLPRIEHWIQNKNVDFYPTNIPRQLFVHPFAQYIILHLRVLTGGEHLINIVSFFSMFGCVILVSLIVKLFGLNYKFQVLAGVLTLSIPTGIIQATSTQTDIVASFFLISFIYFGFSLIKEKGDFYSSLFFCSSSLGLGVLVKPTVAAFALPFCIWFGIEYILKYKYNFIKILIMTTAVILLINFPFYLRNYQLSGYIMGSKDITKMVKNNKIYGSYMVSNIIRNIVVHLPLPVDKYNKTIDEMIDFFHKDILKIKSNERDITVESQKYKTIFDVSQSMTGNFLLTIFILLMNLYLIFYSKRFFSSNKKYLIYYYFCLICGFLIFCALFKWHRQMTRYHIGLFISFIPLITFFFYDVFHNKKGFVKYCIISLIALVFFVFGLAFLDDNINDKKIIFIIFLSIFFIFYYSFRKYKNKLDVFLITLMFLLFISTLPYVYFFRYRPLLNTNSIYKNREYKYFNVFPSLRKEYAEVANILQKFQINKIAIDIGPYRREYLLWGTLREKIKNIEIRHIGFPKLYYKLKNFKKDYKYNAIISNNDSTISQFNRRNIRLYKVFGSGIRDLRLIVLKNAESKQLTYRKIRKKNKRFKKG